MSATVIRQLPILELLSKVKSATRKKILVNADYELIKSIVECIHNVLVGNVELRSKRIKKLKKHKKALRKINSTHNKWIQKKKAIVQSGGSFLPILLTPIITLLLDKLVNN